MIRRLLDWVGYVPAPRVPTLADRAWRIADKGAVKRRLALGPGLDELSRARLHREADELEASAARLFAAHDRRPSAPGPRRAS